MISDKIYVKNSQEQGYVRAKLYKPDIINDTPCAFACVIINEQWNENSLLALKDKKATILKLCNEFSAKLHSRYINLHPLIYKGYRYF